MSLKRLYVDTPHLADKGLTHVAEPELEEAAKKEHKYGYSAHRRSLQDGVGTDDALTDG